MSTLVVSSYTPARGSGRALRTYGLVRALAAHGEVDLLYKRFGASEPDPAYSARLHPVDGAKGPSRALAVLRAQAGGVPVRVARGVTPELGAAAERLAAEPGRERVVAEDMMAAVSLLELARRRPVIYSANNLESAFRTDLGRIKRLRALEVRLLETAAETWLPSRAELEA